MRKNNFIDFLVKNRYTILLVAIVLILSWLGVIRAIVEIGFTLFLILIAIFIGKRIQEDDDYIKRMFRKNSDEIVYHTKKDEEDKE